MKSLVLSLAFLMSAPAFAGYVCTANNGRAEIATKHLDRFSIDLGRDEITLSNLDFRTPGDGGGCGQTPPKGPIRIRRQVPNRARTEPLKSMDQYHPADDVTRDTCFANWNLYVDPRAISEGFELRIQWSDTDGDHSGAGGDVFTCAESMMR